MKKRTQLFAAVAAAFWMTGSAYAQVDHLSRPGESYGNFGARPESTLQRPAESYGQQGQRPAESLGQQGQRPAGAEGQRGQRPAESYGQRGGRPAGVGGRPR